MPKALIFYHYFFPDDVVSATHISELAEGLAQRGWDVTAIPSNRGCRDESRKYQSQEEWNGVHIRRVWRPAFPQASTFGRIVNALWMIVRWSAAALSPGAPDVVIIGTDPVLSVMVARLWKLFRPKTRIVHWCFDLYPEAAVADGVLKANGVLHRLLRWLLRPAYRSCDLIVDIGLCMRALLAVYAPNANFRTLTPWALAEPAAPLPPDPEERKALFGDDAPSLLYSGNFGRAHSYQEILQLTRVLRGTNARLVFSVRGNREAALRNAVKDDDKNIFFCGLAPAERLEQRLSAADIHVVSLHPEWTGTVVPSKFFGAIAGGRPVLFAGSEKSGVAKWIKEYELGWVLHADNVQDIAGQLATHMTIAGECAAIRQNCHEVYQKHFAKEKILDGFDQELRRLLDH
jgi:colanic acid biosynthesis glycosyl transferase WcaI